MQAGWMDWMSEWMNGWANTGSYYAREARDAVPRWIDRSLNFINWKRASISHSNLFFILGTPLKYFGVFCFNAFFFLAHPSVRPSVRSIDWWIGTIEQLNCIIQINRLSFPSLSHTNRKNKQTNKLEISSAYVRFAAIQVLPSRPRNLLKKWFRGPERASVWISFIWVNSSSSSQIKPIEPNL